MGKSYCCISSFFLSGIGYIDIYFNNPTYTPLITIFIYEMS